MGTMTRPSCANTRWWLIPLLAGALVAVSAPQARAQLSALMSPGRLQKAHAALEGLSNCLRCHDTGRTVAAEKCLSCHKPVADRIARKAGVHRTVTDCAKCHREHAGADAELRPFDQKTFGHANETGFPLDGLHAPLAANCAACHKTRSFLGVSTSCVSCHADAHKGSLGPQCARCHSPKVKFATTATNFDHGRTPFLLAGAHTKVDCAKCHVKKQFKGLRFASCSNCHLDPHKSRMGPACSSCHTENAWAAAKAKMNHARTTFQLRGRHATVACEKCHVKPAIVVKLRFDTCRACHTDPHRGTFKQDCSACHTESGFQKGKFNHGTGTSFSLADKHASLDCVACHKSGRPTSNDFKGLKTTCNTCHTDVHRGELGTSCEKCHTPKTFGVTSFTHPNQRPFFAGQHVSLTCAKCHAKTLQPVRTSARVPALRIGFPSTASTCASCHKDVHLGQLGSACERCHAVDTPKFGFPGFSHASTKFPLTGKHVPLTCDKCHKVETGAFPAGNGTARRLSLGTACGACHKEPHRGQLGQDCQTCHSPATFALPGYTHRNARALRAFFTGRHKAATCANCHKPLPGSAPGVKPVPAYKMSTACTGCHVDVHRGALGSACDACHKP